MFAKNKVSQSLVDAVNKIMSEKEVETKEPAESRNIY